MRTGIKIKGMDVFDAMKKRRKWTGNNQGISLVEIIVIVLIIGIMASMMVVNIGYAHSTNVTRAANELSDLLELSRTQTMSMVDNSLEVRIVREPKNYYVKTYKGGVEVNSEELCSSSLAISWYDTTSVLHEIPMPGYITIKFNKGSGSFKFSTDKINGIQVSSGSRTSTLILVEETGRNYVE